MARTFLDLLGELGWVQREQQAATRSGIQSPPPAANPPMPKYESSGNLRVRGEVGQQNRAYVAPMLSRADMMLQQESQQPQPQGSSPSVPHGNPGVARQTVVTDWKSENLRRQQAGLAPLDPQGVEFPAERWATMSPEQQAGVYQQLSEATPAPDAFTPEDDIISQVLRPVVMAPVNAIKAFGEVPILPTSFNPTGGGGDPVTVGDAAEWAVTDVALPALNQLDVYTGRPIRRGTGNAAYYMATHNGERPADDALSLESWLGSFTNVIGYGGEAANTIYNAGAAVTPLDKKENKDNSLIALSMLNYLDAHPEALPEVKRVYEEAIAGGASEDEAGEAVWNHFYEQQGFVTGLIASGLWDASTLVGGGGLLAKSIRNASKVYEAERGATTAGKVMRGGATILNQPNVILNHPGQLLDQVFGGAARVIENIPGVKKLTESADIQTVQDLEQKIASGVETSVSMIQKRLAEDKARRAAARLQGEGRQGYNLPGDISPAEQSGIERAVVRDNLPPEVVVDEGAIIRDRATAQNDAVARATAENEAAAAELAPIQQMSDAQLQEERLRLMQVIPDEALGQDTHLTRRLDLIADEIDARRSGLSSQTPPAGPSTSISGATDEVLPLGPGGIPTDPLMLPASAQSGLPAGPGVHAIDNNWMGKPDAAPVNAITPYQKEVITPVTTQPVATPPSNTVNMDSFNDFAPSRDPLTGTTSKGRIRAGHSVTPNPGGPRMVDQLADNFPDETTGKILPQMDEWSRTVMEPNKDRLTTGGADTTGIKGAEPVPVDYELNKTGPGKPATDPEITYYEGMNKAVGAMLDGQYYARMRFIAHATGVPLNRMGWETPARYLRKVEDAQQTGKGYAPWETYDDRTRDAFVHTYIHADTDAIAMERLLTLESYGFVRRTPPKPIGERARPATRDKYDKDMRAFERYEILQDTRKLATLTSDEIKEMAQAAGHQIPEEAIPTGEITYLQDALLSRGAAKASEITGSILELPPDVRNAVLRDIMDWAQTNASNFSVKTATSKAYTELAYISEVKRSALRSGGDIPLPPPNALTGDSPIEDIVRAAALEPDAGKAAYLTAQLDQMDFISNQIPIDKKLSPLTFAGDKVRYENGLNLRRFRAEWHGKPDAEVFPKITDEQVGKSVQGRLTDPSAPAPAKPPRIVAEGDLTQTRRIDRSELKADPTPEAIVAHAKASQKAFVDATGRKPDRVSLSNYSADQVVADHLALGVFTPSQGELAAMKISIPEYVNEAGVKLRAAREVTVMQIVLEKMVKHDDILTAHRAAGSEIAAALKVVSKEASDLLMTSIKPAQINALLRANRYYLNMVREGYLYNPARVVAAGSLDAMGNAMFQIMGGQGVHLAARTLNPLAWLAFAKHTMKGSEMRHPLFELGEKTGLRVDPNIVTSATREMLNPGANTTWSDFLGNKLHLGRVGDKAASVIAPQWGKAMRTGIDQNARAGVAWNTARRELANARNDFLIELRRSGKDSLANELVPRLNRSGMFSSEDVLRWTGDPDLARTWAKKLDGISNKMTKEVNRIHFSFRRTKLDDALSNVILFHMWQSRAMVFYSRTVITNPYLLNLHVKFWNALEDEADRQGVSGPLQVMVKYMAGDGGLYGWVDWRQWLIPGLMYLEKSKDFSGQTWYDKWTDQLGLFVNPVISTFMTAVGQSKQFDRILPTSAIENMVKSILDWDRNNGDVLGKGPGMTDNWVVYIERRLTDLLNDGAHKALPDVVPDVEVPPQGASDIQQVNALILEQAESEWGPRHNPDGSMAWTQEQNDEVGAAIAALDIGSTDNQRTNEALQQWSDGQLVEAAVRTTLPGQSYVRSEVYDENRDAVSAAIESPEKTPQEQAVFDTNALMTGGSAEATTLTVEKQNLDALGTEEQRALYEGWNAIAHDQIPDDAMEVIDGRIYWGWQVNAMSQKTRYALADLWAKENMPGSVDTDPDDGIEPKTELDQYKDEREGYIGGTTELKGYQEYKARAGDFPGGEREFREFASGESDEFAQELNKERKRLIDKGVSGESLEEQLDMWTFSMDGYNAARAVRDSLSDPNPLDSPTEVPMSNAETKQMVTDAVADGVKDAGGGGGASGSGGFNQEYSRPQFQVDLIQEYDAYKNVIAGFEQQHGPVSNFQSRQGMAAVENYLAENGITEISSDLSKLMEWLADNPDAGIDDYLDMLDAEYKAKKAAKGK